MITPTVFWAYLLAAVVMSLTVRWLGGLVGLVALWCLLGQPNLLAWWPPAVPVETRGVAPAISAPWAMIPPPPPDTP